MGRAGKAEQYIDSSEDEYVDSSEEDEVPLSKRGKKAPITTAPDEYVDSSEEEEVALLKRGKKARIGTAPPTKQKKITARQQSTALMRAANGPDNSTGSVKGGTKRLRQQAPKKQVRGEEETVQGWFMVGWLYA